MSSKIRIRYSPAGAGNLHLGEAAVALVADLFARAAGGTLLLCIADPNSATAGPEYLPAWWEALSWLGIAWNEGPDIGGPHAPYFQNQRVHRYSQAVQALIGQGRAYYCFCPSRRYRQPDQGANRTTVRAGCIGECTSLDRKESSARIEAGATPLVRLRMPTGPFEFHDPAARILTFPAGSFPDPALLRPDGTVNPHLAMVVDDISMRVTHVVRGSDHLGNLPIRLALFRALNSPPPCFIHVPRLLSTAGRKDSPRHLLPGILELKERGFLPTAIFAYLAGTGLLPLDRKHLPPPSRTCRPDPDQRLAAWSSTGIRAPAARFDPMALNWHLKNCLKSLDDDSLLEYCMELLGRRGLVPDRVSESTIKKLRRMVKHSRDRLISPDAITMECLAILDGESPPRLINEPINASELMVERCAYRQGGLKEEALTLLESGRPWPPAGLTTVLRKRGMKMGLEPGEIFPYLRKLLTGKSQGMKLEEILELLGRREALARLCRTSPKSPLAALSDQSARRETRQVAYYVAHKLAAGGSLRVALTEGAPENRMYHVEGNGHCWVVKLSLNNQVGRLVTEARTLSALDGSGLAPALAILDLGGGIGGRPLLAWRSTPGHPRGVLQPGKHIHNEIIATLARLHALEISHPTVAGSLPQIGFCSLEAYHHHLAGQLQLYLAFRRRDELDDNHLTRILAELVLGLEKKAKEMRALFLPGLPKALCHGDLHRHNILLDGGRIHFINWEGAGWGDPAFDLSWHIAINHLLSREESTAREVYIDSRAGSIDPDFRDRHDAYLLFHRLMWPLRLLNHAYRLKFDHYRAAVPREFLVATCLDQARRMLVRAIKAGAELIPGLRSFDHHGLERLGPLMAQGDLPDSAWLNELPPLVVAVDGAAGTGKGLVAAALAQALGFFCINSGSLYRALTACALEAGIDPVDHSALAQLARRSRFDLRPAEEPPHFTCLVNHVDLTDRLHSRPVEYNVAQVAAHPEVREVINRTIRRLAGGRVVVDGHDIGTRVLPGADLKVFLTADMDIRVEREFQRLNEAGVQVSREEVIAALKERNRIDSRFTRPANDALVLDTSINGIQRTTRAIIDRLRGGAFSVAGG